MFSLSQSGFQIILIFVVLLAASARQIIADVDQQPVNVVLILADDLGWTDVGCFGSRLHQTPGGVCDSPVHGCDLFPTICTAANADPRALDHSQQLDGRNLSPLLKDPQRTLRQRSLFWHYPHFSTMGGRPSGAVRRGKWKLIEHFESGKLELYNLKDDIGETVDVSQSHPVEVDNLHQSLVGWRKRMNALMPTRPNPDYQGAEQ